jgi:hypothetical protein
MKSWHRGLVVLLTILGASALMPGVIYIIGLAKVRDRPVAADPTDYSSSVIAAAWLRCGESLPATVRPGSPRQFAGKLLFGAPTNAAPGERAAWRIASTHNAAHPVGHNLWWHTSGAALSIWLTRHWSAEQMGATLVRDNLCR